MSIRWFRPFCLCVLLCTAFGSARADTDLIPAGALWREFPGRTPASQPDATEWRQPGFADTTWDLKPAPFFYGRPYAGTELSDMRGAYTSVFLRKTFVAANHDQIGELLLNVLSDDGFVAWINGHEVARKNVPEGELAHTATALGPVTEPVAFEEFSVPRPWEILVEGDNVLCIQAFNAAIDSADFAIDARLVASVDTTPPVVTQVIPPAGSTVDELTVAEVFFSEPVQGVTADDLLVNGAAATAVSLVAPGHYSFSFAAPAAGVVQFTWKAGHGITDVLGQGNPFDGSVGWSVTLDPAAVRKNLMISEFMADNNRAVYDDDCDNPDWIEIYNAGASPMNLEGWALTDDPADLGKWRFPDYTLDGGAYMIVFASQKDKKVLTPKITGPCKAKPNAFIGFHTNFKLGPNGEYLALVAPDGEVISEFNPYPPQRRDISYGRVPGAAAEFAYFAQPTPAAPNSASGAGFTPAVTFSQPGGTYLRPFALTLSCENPAAEIRYTLDGSFPNETNKALVTYTSPIALSKTVQVRARAFAPGLLPSAPASQTYLALTNRQDHLNSFTSSLPILVMTTLKTNVGVGTSRNTTVHFTLFEPRDGLTTLLSRPTLTARGGAKIRGSSTEGEPQSNFAIQWEDEFDQDLKLPVLGMPTDSEWVLYAPNEFDPPLIHNPFTMELSRQMNSPTELTRFVEVYYNRGGQIRSNDWNGVYVLMQKPGIAKGRVDIVKAQPEDVAFPEVTGGYMFKSDRLDPGDSGINIDGAPCGFVEPKEREMKSPQRAPQLAYLKKYFTDMAEAFKPSNPNYRDPVLGYRAFVEMTNWVDFHMLETLSGQVDAIRLSTYFYKRREGKLEFGPRWDYDRAWESKSDGRDDNPRIWDTGGGLFGPPWFTKFFTDRDAWQLWCDRWAMYRQTVLSRTNMFAVIDRMTNEVRWVQPREAKKWINTVPRVNYPNEILIMKTWISNRLAWIDSQFSPAPLLSSGDAVVAPGFQVTIGTPAGISAPGNVKIFYTLDGSDPRPAAGTNTPTAFEYSGPITITTNTRVVARIRDTGHQQRSGPPSSTPWSAPVAATFVVTPPPLVLTELMFHPASPPSGSPWSAGDFEFLELKNITDHAVNLVGYHFVAGIHFQFTAASAVTELAPGARVLVVANLDAFLSRYPGATSIAGQFTGNLADGGDRLVLHGPVEEPIFDFTYGDHWQPVADGVGFSLVLRDEATPPGQLGDAGKWRASAAEGGSPGLADGVGITSPHVLVNEVLAYPLAGSDDAIELFNPGNASVDVSGWWLTDNSQSPKKYQLPASTVIGPGGYLVVHESAFGLGDRGFALSATGDSAWLFAVDQDGNLTGGYHGFEFGPSEPGVTFGRQPVSDGSEQFVAQSSPTLGAANAGPRMGPVVFSELALARSAAGQANDVRDEFIELRNVSGQPVSLFDPAGPDQTWHLRGDVDFDLPTGVTLPPAGHLLIVGFDPARDIYENAAFHARYGLDAATPVFGPWHGVLDLTGGSLRLHKPGVPNPPSGDRGPAILVEEVRFSPDAPWPASGLTPGQSLVRRNLEAFANDGANWAAADPTPGDDDADADGLGDTWEIANGLNPASAVGDDGPDGDPDGDGFSNRLEARNHTAAREAGSRLRLGAYLASPNLVNFTFAAPAGHEFTLEYRENLGDAPWQTLRTVTAPADGSIVITAEAVTAGVRYFRLAQP